MPAQAGIQDQHGKPRFPSLTGISCKFRRLTGAGIGNGKGSSDLASLLSQRSPRFLHCVRVLMQFSFLGSSPHHENRLQWHPLTVSANIIDWRTEPHVPGNSCGSYRDSRRNGHHSGWRCFAESLPKPFSPKPGWETT